MLTYIIRRLLLMIPTLIGITLVVFFTMTLSPGGVGANVMTATGSVRGGDRKAVEEYYRNRYHLDDPVWVRYLRWVNNISPLGLSKPEGKLTFGFKTPDFGHSYSKGRPVFDLIGEALPITFLLNLVTLPLTFFVAAVCGIYMARKRGELFDVVTGTSFLTLYSLPVMWVGILLIGFLCSEKYLNWFPVAGLHSLEALEQPFLPSHAADGTFLPGYLLDACWHLVLPVVCLSYAGFAYLSKQMRGAVLENISADYVRTARAKGADEQRVLWVHTVRNSLLPLITIGAGLIPAMIGGSLVVEKMFSIDGMGKLAIEAINARDYEIVMATTLFAGLLGLICSIIRDVVYAFVDPRISYE